LMRCLIYSVFLGEHERRAIDIRAVQESVDICVDQEPNFFPRMTNVAHASRPPRGPEAVGTSSGKIDKVDRPLRRAMLMIAASPPNFSIEVAAATTARSTYHL
jgi:hypothetical protein